MHTTTVLSATGRVLASGCVCPLCDRLTDPRDLDVVDVGQGPGVPVCVRCWLEVDERAALSDPGEPAPWELTYEAGASDQAAE